MRPCRAHMPGLVDDKNFNGMHDAYGWALVLRSMTHPGRICQVWLMIRISMGRTTHTGATWYWGRWRMSSRTPIPGRIRVSPKPGITKRISEKPGAEGVNTIEIAVLAWIHQTIGILWWQNVFRWLNICYLSKGAAMIKIIWALSVWMSQWCIVLSVLYFYYILFCKGAGEYFRSCTPTGHAQCIYFSNQPLYR